MNFLDVLKLQPDYVVLRSSLPNLRSPASMEAVQRPGEFLDVAQFIKSYHPRTRITKVEVESNLDGLDVARITFIDPEYELISLANWNYIWQVGIGWAGLHKRHWATIVGVPQIEMPQFPNEGEPSITLVLLSAVVRMTKHHTFNPVLENEQLCKAADIAEVRRAPNPIRNAVARIALSHGLLPHFGIPRPTDALVEYDTQHQPDKVLDDLFPLMSTLNDAQYLDKIVTFLNAKEMEKYQKSAGKKSEPQGVTERQAESYNVSQKAVIFLEENMYQWGQIGKFLVLAKWRRDIFDTQFGLGGKIIPVFQYRHGNMALLEFHPRLSKAPSEKGWEALNINRRTGKIEHVAISEDGKLMEDIVPLNLEDPRIRKETETLQKNEVKRDAALLLSVGPDRSEALLDLSHVYAMRGLNIEGEATVLGYPYLRAGMLVGFGGLGKAPETVDKSEAQKFFSLNRLYLVQRATHTLDAQTGKYRTRLQVASADSERYGRHKLIEALAKLDKPQIDDMGNKMFQPQFGDGED